MGVSQARVSKLESGDLSRTEVGTLQSYIAALVGQLRIVAEFGEKTVELAGMTGPSQGRPENSVVLRLITAYPGRIHTGAKAAANLTVLREPAQLRLLVPRCDTVCNMTQ